MCPSQQSFEITTKKLLVNKMILFWNKCIRNENLWEKFIKAKELKKRYQVAKSNICSVSCYWFSVSLFAFQLSA